MFLYRIFLFKTCYIFNYNYKCNISIKISEICIEFLGIHYSQTLDW